MSQVQLKLKAWIISLCWLCLKIYFEICPRIWKQVEQSRSIRFICWCLAKSSIFLKKVFILDGYGNLVVSTSLVRLTCHYHHTGHLTKAFKQIRADVGVYSYIRVNQCLGIFARLSISKCLELRVKFGYRVYNTRLHGLTQFLFPSETSGFIWF